MLKKVKETTISSLCHFYVFVRVIFVMLLKNFEVTPRYYKLLKHQSIHTYIVRINTTKHNCITQDTCANFLTILMKQNTSASWLVLKTKPVYPLNVFFLYNTKMNICNHHALICLFI